MARRPQILRKMHQKPHRYRWLRGLSQALTLAALWTVPLLGIVRIDLWGGQHLFRGQTVSFGGAVVGACLTTVVFYLITYVVNMFFARMFCGWGCPVGQLHRFGDASEGKGPAWRRWGPLVLHSAAVAAAFIPWWVDLAVFRDGSALAISATVGGWLGLTVVCALQGRFWRWAFCKSWCPIGLYYSIIRTEKSQSVVFDNAAKTCIDCGVCDKVCPVGLAPRDLQGTMPHRGGFSIAGLAGHNHCLTCGDCVESCEMVLAKKPGPIPLLFGIPKQPEAQPEPAQEEAVSAES